MNSYKKICISARNLVQGDFIMQIEKVAASGVDLLVLREKDLTKEAYKELAEQVIAVCRKWGVVCMMHTYTDAARELNHPYIHLPFETFMKMSKEEREYFKVIGVSTHKVEEALEAKKNGASYITASHIFPTACKEGLAPRGLDYLREVVRAVKEVSYGEPMEVYALGGIHPDNIQQCLDAGADGVCMMSEYMKL